MAKVSELVKSCLLDFNTLISSDGLAGKIQEVPLQAWRDELGRLRVWVANIGAHQTGQSSLDYRLRDASHISGQIMSLLRRIKELLLDLTEILEEDTAMATSADDGPEDFGQHLTDEHEMTEIQQIHQGLLEAITQLYQMSIIIRQPAHHDRLIGTQKNDIEPFIFWARQHASHKYPHADELIIDRISSMMARGKAILRYRERHHSKLSRGIDPEDEQSTVLSETVVTDVYNETNQCHDMASQSGITQTSYRDTLLGGTDEGGRPIPPIPKDGIDQSPFECPYCFYIITVRDDQAWARHIFQDVMPYICIFPDCPTPNKPYENRRSWYAHIQQKHPLTGTSYDCSICRQDSLPSVTFKQHVAGHLQELALLYVPNTRIGEDENLQASALFEENGNIGEKRAYGSYTRYTQPVGSAAACHQEVMYPSNQLSNLLPLYDFLG
ncbi:hypothetical protein N7457_001915 [Penicillium paradoxum]|uniref:uncharacterized protein n=1 Tax=Penicillium paradoxum TaxID=176176 RepID=UPI00254819B7|nr:uncharacterized protein N7457_001915 [Penicillium paradoxum]KAJ5795316.1 hypothetical protein N7457_001915 [Penicillium paradoxum]